EYDILLKNVSIYDLAKAFKRAIEEIKEEPVHQVRKINISIDEQIDFIFSQFKEKTEVHFLTLVEKMTEKIRVVITFIALLELVKMSRVGIKESPNYNDFILYRIENGQDLQFNN
ncbi:MAG: segregation/condensation protein A, partial [Ignavibacteriaceae bacterium]